MSSSLHTLRLIPLAACFVLASACAPIDHAAVADHYALQRSEVEGDGFRHLVYQRINQPGNERLHVYIEGDGIPWIGNRPSADPTPRHALALNLASEDPHDIVYVGRPCYFQVQTLGKCAPKYWTSHRYGDAVVRSMAGVIRQVRRPQHREIVLIGHSGGGAIAALLESRIEDVVAVVTVTANLDIDKWTEYHDYDALDGSLNPAQQPTNPGIPKFQLVGRADEKVPLHTVSHYGEGRGNVELLVYEDFDHVCCWEKEWGSFLAELDRALANEAAY